MKLQNLTIIFIIIVLPVILLTTFYISTGLKTIKYQALYDTGLITATQDAIQAFELNSLNNKYSGNAETKRSIIKSSVKMLETSLCNTCNISSYNTDEIEEYIPAIMFGLSDGFYVYAPSFNPTTNKYEHSLKSYVYYSETLNADDGIIIRYYLDSYIHVSGYIDSSYQSEEGYLININDTKFYNDSGSQCDFSSFNRASGTIKYYGVEIDMKDELAVNYFIDNYKFSKWFNDCLINPAVITDRTLEGALTISESNDPEDPESEFSKHKKELIKSKIEGVLNSTITAYSERNKQEYKMPKLSEEDWEKIYTDVSVTTFFQGKKIGLTKYNGYCVLNSNNHYETINPNLLYFSTDGDATDSSDDDNIINTTSDYYHDIRCSEITNVTSIREASTDITTLRGWKIGRFQKIKTTSELRDGIETGHSGDEYVYERAELACYSCINGSVGNTSVYDYIEVANSDSHTGNTTISFIKRSYWTSLARERAQLSINKELPSEISITKKVEPTADIAFSYDEGILTVINGSKVKYTITITNKANKNDYITVSDVVSKGSIYDIEEITLLKEDGSRMDISSWKAEDDMKWSELPIEPNQTITITYKANVSTDLYDRQITNTVTAWAGGVSYSAHATCKTLESDIAITKNVSVANVEYGGTVDYEITVTNNAALEDKVIIEDIFYKAQIEIKGFSGSDLEFTTSDYYRTSGNVTITSYDGAEETIGDTTIGWKDVKLAANGGKVTIKYKAKLEGNIGEIIKNTAKVKSEYTDDEKWQTCSATCTMEKKVNVNVTTRGYNIVLVLDNSWSMYNKKKIDKLFLGVHSFLDNIISKKIADTSVITIIEFNNSPTVRYDYVSGNENIKNISDLYLKDCNDVKDKYSLETFTSIGQTTVYHLALESAKSKLNTMKDAYPNNKNLFVFFSDGAPTFASENYGIGLGWTGYSLTGKRNIFNSNTYWMSGLGFGMTSASDAGDNIWFNYDNSISKMGKAIYDMGTEMYVAYYPAESGCPTYGLKRYLTTTGLKNSSEYDENGRNSYFYEANSSSDINNLFEGIANSALETIDVTPKTSTSGKIYGIEQVNSISAIKIGSSSLPNEELLIIKSLILNSSDQKTLDLTYKPPEGTENRDAIIMVLGKFKTAETITICY